MASVFVTCYVLAALQVSPKSSLNQPVAGLDGIIRTAAATLLEVYDKYSNSLFKAAYGPVYYPNRITNDDIALPDSRVDRDVYQLACSTSCLADSMVELVKSTSDFVAEFVAEAGGPFNGGPFNDGDLSGSGPSDDGGPSGDGYFDRASFHALSSDKASSADAPVIYNLACDKPARDTAGGSDDDDDGDSRHDVAARLSCETINGWVIPHDQLYMAPEYRA